VTAEEILVARLKASPQVTALVGSRIYPMVIPQGVVMPAIAYQRISTVRPGSLRGPSGIADPRLQVNCWADTYGTAKTVAEEVRQSLDGWDVNGVATLILGEHDLLNPDGLRKCVTQDYSMWVPE
jgi:Protein of unknown function (DUF3168)